ALTDESRRRYDTAERLFSQGAMSREDKDAALLTWVKYSEEQDVKFDGITIAKADLGVSDLLVRQHELRNKIFLPSSRIQTIYKNSGDSLKSSEPIMQLVNAEYLEAQGMVDVSVKNWIQQGRTVIVEPSQEEKPASRLEAHRGKINGVAIARDGKFVSASEDKTLCVWSRPQP